MLVIFHLCDFLLDVPREAKGPFFPSEHVKWVQIRRSLLCVSRFLHILMIFWSFLAGVITFYCSLGPESLLPSFLFTMKPRHKVCQLFLVPSGRLMCKCVNMYDNISVSLIFQQRQAQELFPLGHSCAVCGKVKCKRHRYVTGGLSR